MELDCYMGQKHGWQPTGNGYRLWQDNTTSVEHAPKDAPYYAVEKCWRCGAVRHVTHMPPNA